MTRSAESAATAAPADLISREVAVERRVERLARLLDGAFQVPGTRFRLGWDAVIGLVPVAGDAVGVALSSYIIFLAARAGVPARLRWRMAANVGIDFLLGLVPVVGDVLDVASRANTRNLRLLQGWLQERRLERERAQRRAACSGSRRDTVRMLLLLALALALLSGAWVALRMAGSWSG